MTTIAPGRARQAQLPAESSATTGGVILVARFAAGAVLNYAFGLGLAWLLVPERFGVVSAVQNVLLLAAGLLNAGLPWALAIRVAKAHADVVRHGRDTVTAILNGSDDRLLVVVGPRSAWPGSGLRKIPTVAPAESEPGVETPGAAG